MTTEPFTVVLKRLRESKHLSQSRLADQAAFDHSFVSRLEAGGRLPSRETVVKLAFAMKATTEERVELMTAAGFLSVDGPQLADPALARLHAILSHGRLSKATEQMIRASLALIAEYAEQAA